jgi:hypothetical protein
VDARVVAVSSQVDLALIKVAGPPDG